MAKDFAQDLPALIGKEIDDPDIARFLKKLDSGEAVRLTKLKEPRWISQKAGVEVHAAPKSRRITTVFLYSGADGGFKKYKGPLPHGIKFEMNLDQVKACFPKKKPDHSSDAHATWDFDDYRIVSTFESGDDMTSVALTSII